MDKMWAPWRMDYIRQNDDPGCFLCRICAQKSDRENLLLKRGRTCGVVMNRYPYNNGHLLVFPYQHTAGIDRTTSEERLEIMNLIDECITAIGSAINPDGYNVGYNLGKIAGAGLETHLHAHIVPRWNGDTNFMPVVGDVKVIPQALLDLYDQLKPEFQTSTLSQKS